MFGVIAFTLLALGCVMWWFGSGNTRFWQTGIEKRQTSVEQEVDTLKKMQQCESEGVVTQ